MFRSEECGYCLARGVDNGIIQEMIGLQNRKCRNDRLRISVHITAQNDACHAILQYIRNPATHSRENEIPAQHIFEKQVRDPFVVSVIGFFGIADMAVVVRKDFEEFPVFEKPVPDNLLSERRVRDYPVYLGSERSGSDETDCLDRTSSLVEPPEELQ